MSDPDGVEVVRQQLEVNGTTLSCLTAGDPTAPPLLLLHGTFWSRVWQPVLPALGTAAPRSSPPGDVLPDRMILSCNACATALY